MDIGIHIFSIYVILPIFERRPPFGIRPAAPDPDAEQIEFPTANGMTLRGSLYKPKNSPSKGMILFCPEFGGIHWSAKWYAAGLMDAGFTVLSFDFRNIGSSDQIPNYKATHWLSRYEVEDVKAAMKYIASRPDLSELNLGFFGISRGGGAALATAAQTGGVKCIATEGSFTTDSIMFFFTIRWATLYVPMWLMKILPDWHLQFTLALVRRVSQIRHGCKYVVTERYLPKLKNTPILMMNGTKDSYVKHTIAEGIIEKAGGQEHHELWRIKKASHNQGREINAEMYDQRIVEFFSQLESSPEKDALQTTEN